MLKALKNLVWGGNNDDKEASSSGSLRENSVTVSEEQFRNAISHINRIKKADFLVALPFAKLRFCIPQGEYAGNSYLWLLAENAFNGEPGPLEAVSKHITLDDLRTKPNNDDRTLLWLITSAAYKGNAKSLMTILKNCGTKLTSDDLEGEAADQTIRYLLTEVAHTLPKIGYYIPGLLNEKVSHYADDDSCGSAGTLNADDIDDDISRENSDHDDDDMDTVLALGNMKLAQEPTGLKTWKQHQLSINAQKSLVSPKPGAPTTGSHRRHKR